MSVRIAGGDGDTRITCEGDFFIDEGDGEVALL